MVISFYASSCIKKIHDLDSIFAHLGILILRTITSVAQNNPLSVSVGFLTNSLSMKIFLVLLTCQPQTVPRCTLCWRTFSYNVICLLTTMSLQYVGTDITCSHPHEAALSVHCLAHCINLEVSSSCKAAPDILHTVYDCVRNREWVKRKLCVSREQFMRAWFVLEVISKQTSPNPVDHSMEPDCFKLDHSCQQTTQPEARLWN